MKRLLAACAVALPACASGPVAAPAPAETVAETLVSPSVPRVTGDILGAWADGIAPDACETEQITYFTADGVVMDLYTKAGPVHSFGAWRRDGARLALTHNEFPLAAATGEASGDFPFTIVRLDADRLDMRNAKGELRERRRCPGLALSDTAPRREE